MKKKLLIFDMDGVLFDSIGFAQKKFIERHPGVTDEMYKEIHSGNFYEESKKYDYLKIKKTEEEEAEYKIAYAKSKSKSQMFKGIKNLLEELHSLGYILVLNTNAYKSNCLPLLELSGIKSVFDFIATADLSESKIKKFKFIKDKYKFNKEDILFITDALGDVREADVSNIPTVAVTWGVHDESHFNREPHDNLVGIINSIDELKDFI